MRPTGATSRMPVLRVRAAAAARSAAMAQCSRLAAYRQPTLRAKNSDSVYTAEKKNDSGAKASSSTVASAAPCPSSIEVSRCSSTSPTAKAARLISTPARTFDPTTPPRPAVSSGYRGKNEVLTNCVYPWAAIWR
jgi:hypothetical protein